MTKFVFENTDMMLIGDIISVAHNYYEKNDGAHQLEHAIDVMMLGVNMWHDMTVPNINKQDIIAAGLLHDIALYLGREFHHLNAVDILQTTLSVWFDSIVSEYNLNKHQVFCAISEHRASYKDTFTYPICELISSADRGKPDIHKLIARIKNFQPIQTPEQGMAHLVDKFGSTGYANYPELYRRYFSAELSDMQSVICNSELLYKLYTTEV